MSNTRKVYQLSLNTEFDKDILDWLDSMPNVRKGEQVRAAIRSYMNGGIAVPPPVHVVPALTPVEKKKRGSKSLLDN